MFRQLNNSRTGVYIISLVIVMCIGALLWYQNIFNNQIVKQLYSSRAQVNEQDNPASNLNGLKNEFLNSSIVNKEAKLYETYMKHIDDMKPRPTDIVYSQPNYTPGVMTEDFPTDKLVVHNYVIYYDVLVRPYQLLDSINILEIGVSRGGSMILWRKVFGENANIYGVDINPKVANKNFGPKTKILILDSRNQSLIYETFKEIQFDIIIDDGDHRIEAIWATFESFFKFLKPTGIYVIEDAFVGLPFPADKVPMEKIIELNRKSRSGHPDGNGVGFKIAQLKSVGNKPTEWMFVIYPEKSLAPKIYPGLVTATLDMNV